MLGLTMKCHARIPGDLDLGQIFDSKPMIDRAAWLIGAILEKQICFSDCSGAPMSSAEIRKICGNPVTTKTIVDGLKAAGVLFVGKNYEVGRTFKRYAINPRLFRKTTIKGNNIVHHEITAPTVIRTIRKSLERHKNYEFFRWGDFHYDIYSELQQPKLDAEEAERCFDIILSEGEKADQGLAAIMGFQVDQLKTDTTVKMSVSKTGRVYTPLCRLKSWLRGCMQYDGEWCVGHDVKACQPTLLAALMMCVANKDVSFFTKKDVAKRVKILGIGLKPIGKCDISRADAQEFADFVENCDIYETLVDDLKKRGHYRTRDDMKLAFMRDIFAKRGSYASVEEHAFKQRFPVVWQQIKKINELDYRTLINFMQFMESEVVIHHALKKAYDFGCRGFFTVHDSIYATESYTNLILQGFEYASEMVGIRLNIDVSDNIVVKRQEEQELAQQRQHFAEIMFEA